MTRIASAVTCVVALSVLLLAACGAPVRVADESHVAPGHRWLRFSGRVDRSDRRQTRFGWPGTSVEARFSGSRICADLVDAPLEDTIRETDWIEVMIDDGPPIVRALSEGRKEYCFAARETRSFHQIRITKRTEGEVGEIALLGLRLESGHRVAAPGPAPTRHLEFVGDSITAGYGTEGENGLCHWSASTENASRTYAAVAARALGASFSLIAWSGKGLLRNYDPRDRETLPRIYERTLPTRSGSAHSDGPRADVVVINLGTNDWFPGVPDRAAWIDAYLGLIVRVRTRHPGARIVLALGPMLADDFPQPNARTQTRAWMREVAARAGEQDNPLDLIEFWTDPAEGVGCDFHPNVRTHARLGQELAALLSR